MNLKKIQSQTVNVYQMTNFVYEYACIKNLALILLLFLNS